MGDGLREMGGQVATTSSEPNDRPAMQVLIAEDDENRYQALLGLIDQGYSVIEMIFDDAGRPVDYLFIEVNRAFEGQTGLIAPEGRRARELVPDLEEHWFRIYGDVALTGQSVQVTNQAAPMDERWFEVNAFRVGGADSRRVGVLFKDVSAAIRSQRMQQDFIAMVSHDLNSPMSVIRAQAQLMRRRERYSERGLDAVLEQARRMEVLLADLRDAVRADAGWLHLRPVPTTLEALARACVERMIVQSDAHTTTLEAPMGPVPGMWDADRIGQILDNLVGNAAKYAPDGSAITVRVETVGPVALLSVLDRGPGIPEDQAPHLFERFYRVSETGAVPGMGLGLYIVSAIVQAHGGRVGVEPRDGGGSVFSVELPIVPID